MGFTSCGRTGLRRLRCAPGEFFEPCQFEFPEPTPTSLVVVSSANVRRAACSPNSASQECLPARNARSTTRHLCSFGYVGLYVSPLAMRPWAGAEYSSPALAQGGLSEV